MRCLSPIWISSLLLATPAPAQQAEDPLAREVADILAQPGRDIGIVPTKVPELLEKLMANPYSLENTESCKEIRTGIARLSAVIGPDFDAPKAAEPAERRIMTAGARAGASSLIPFRGLVREATGAAEADRRKDRAIDAAIARRGFLRGLAHARRCRISPEQ
jgi:hypothetical protein